MTSIDEPPAGPVSGPSGSEADRSQHRYRRAGLAAATSLVSKAVTMVTGLAMVPLMLDYLGPLEYGIWLTMQSILAFTAFADFGIGNGAMNSITTAHARGLRDDVNRTLSTAMAMLTGSAAVLLLALTASWPLIPWTGLLRLDGHTKTAEVSAGIAVCGVYFATALPLAFVEKLTTAFQEGNVAHSARTVAAVLSLGAVWSASQLGGSFAVVCAATLAPTALAWIGAWWLVMAGHSWLRLSFVSSSFAEMTQLLRKGVVFFAIQVCALIGFSLDNLFITAALGPEWVSAYAVPYRLFSVVFLLVGIVVTPLWPAYADAHAVGDRRWIRQAFLRSLLAALALSLTTATGLALLLPTILHAWVGDKVSVSPVMTFGLAAFTVLQSVGSVFAMLWNGTSTLRLQFLLGCVFVAVATPLKIYALRTWGLEYLPLVTASVYLITTLLPAGLFTTGPLLRVANSPIGAARQNP